MVHGGVLGSGSSIRYLAGGVRGPHQGGIKLDGGVVRIGVGCARVVGEGLVERRLEEVAGSGRRAWVEGPF